MNHYFSDNKHLRSLETETEYIFRFTRFAFITDAGVFAKGGVDSATHILLENLPEIQAGARVLDLGCGYGAVGVVINKIYGADVIMADVNERALDLSKRNLEKNGAAAGIIKSDGFADITGRFEHIMLNPPIHAGKPVIYKIYEDAREYLSPNGAFYIVIRKKHGALSHRQKLEEIFGKENLSVLYSKKGVFVFEVRKGLA